MKKPRISPVDVPRGRSAKDSQSINPDAPSGPGPEPSLAMRMARAIMADAFETGVPPFDGDAQPVEVEEPTSARISSQIESQPVLDRGGRVDAVGATSGRGDRAGAAAIGIPVQSVGAAMSTPRVPEHRRSSPQVKPTRSTHLPQRDDGAKADED